MPFEFKLPDIGEGIAEAEIVKWLVKEGDNVKEDQPIAQIETDKAVVDIPSPKSGTILKINVSAGSRAKVGAVLVVIGAEGESSKSLAKKEEKKETTSSPKRGQSVVGQLPEAPEDTDYKPMATVMRPVPESTEVLAAPAVRKFAADNGLALATVKGSGPEGRILLEDVKNLPSIPQQRVPVVSQKEAEGLIERLPLKGIRKTIAENMVASIRNCPQATLTEDVRIDRLLALKQRENEKLKKKGMHLTLLPFVMRALIPSLKAHPLLNATVEAEEIVLKKYYSFGVAVETEVGLMVPVVKNAEHKSITQLAGEIVVLAEKARTRTIALDELRGSTFTITNYGSVGGVYGTPIINPGESAILGMGRGFTRLALVKGKPVEQSFLPLSLTFDHRIIDGGQAARFMETLKGYLEDPDALLLELS